MDTPENPQDPPVTPPSTNGKKPRKRKPKPTFLEGLEKNCASCTHFLRTGDDSGDCYGGRPSVVVLEGPDGLYPETMRPNVSPDDKACGDFEFAM